MAKIAFFELDQFGLGHTKPYIKKRLRGHNVNFFDRSLNAKNAKVAKDCDIVAFFVHSKIDKNTLDQIPKIKLLTTMSTGFDHIDLNICKAKQITVSYVPAYGSHTVAEHALALLLALSKNIVASVKHTRQGNFDLKGLRGFDLQGKTLGLIGSGKIGRHLAQYAKALDMKVISYDKFKNETLAKECGFEYVTFNKLLKNSDVISLHLPETKQTHHIINKKNLDKIKKGCVLINTARGGLVETAALVKGIKNGTFSALGLDVLEEETVIKEESQLLHKRHTIKQHQILKQEHTLLKHKNVIITPHNAFNSHEALMRIVNTTIDNITSYLGKKPKNIVKS